MKTETFDPETLERLIGPIVYVHRRYDTIIYIGFSRHGIYRCFSHCKFDKNDRLEIICCTTDEEAALLGKQLIREHKPIQNKLGVRKKLMAHTKKIRKMNPRRIDIYLDRMIGETLEEIGKRYGISKQRVNQILESIKTNKSERIISDEEFNLWLRF